MGIEIASYTPRPVCVSIVGANSDSRYSRSVLDGEIFRLNRKDSKVREAKDKRKRVTGVMKRPAHFCLRIATLTTIMSIGGARGATIDSFLANKSMLEVENGSVLRLFFAEMVRVIGNGKWNPRHATILSHFKEDFDAAAPFCEIYSCFSGKRLREFRPSKAFATNGLIVWFPSSMKFAWTDTERFKEHRDILVMRGPVSLEEVTGLFRQSEIARIGRINIVVDEGSSVKLYAPEPTGGCQIKSRLIIAWRPGQKIPEIPLQRFEWSVSYRDCLVTLSTSNEMPSMKVKNVGGKMTVVGGLEGVILMVTAQKMNFNLEVNYLASTNDENVSIQQKIVNNVAQGRSDLGIGQIRRTNRVEKSLVAFASTFMTEHVYWCIPRFVGEESNILTLEFSWPIWILILFVFFVMIGCVHVFRALSRTNFEAARRREQGRTDLLITREKLRNRGKWAIRRDPKRWGKMILDVFSMSLGYPVLVDPITTSARILLFTFLYYVMVMTTAYKSSLSSMLTVEIDKPLITDANGIIAANMTTGGEINELEVLKDQADAPPENRELIRRYVVYPTREAARKRISANRDFAYLSPMTDLTYDDNVWANADAYSQYQILHDGVLTYNTVIVWQANTSLRIPMQQIVLRCRESGLIEHWKSRTLNAKIKAALTAETVENSRNKRGLIAKYSRIFVYHAVCMLISSLVFLAELLVHKFA